MRKMIFAAMMLLVTVAPAMAWNCPSGQIRVQAPAGTPTSTPYYDVVEGIAFICQPSTPPTPVPTPTSKNQNQSQNQSNSQNQSLTNNIGIATSSTNSNSNTNVNKSTSTSNSNASSSSASNSSSTSNSGVTNSGNSSSTANGGSATANGGSASAQNNSSGNSTSYSNETNIRPAAATAFASAQSTASCFKGLGVGGQTVAGGFSFSGGRVDQNCARLETARSYALFGADIAYCKVMANDKFSREAGVTFDDCMKRRLAVIAAPVPVPVPEQKIVVVPVVVPTPAPAPVPVVQQSTGQLISLGGCEVARMNVCNRIIDSAFVYLDREPDSELVVEGPLQSTSPIINYVKTRGYNANRIRLRLEDQNSISIGVWSVQ